MAASEYVLIDSNSIQLLYIGSATVTRNATTAPSRGTLPAMLEKQNVKNDKYGIRQYKI